MHISGKWCVRAIRPGAIAAILLAALVLQPPRLAADARHRRLIREMGQAAVQMAAASRPDHAIGERYRKAVTEHDNLPFDHATSRCAEIVSRAFAHGASAAGLRKMKHRGADTVERETQEMVAEANRCLGDEFNTSSGDEKAPPRRAPGHDEFNTGDSPDRPAPTPQRPEQTPRRPQPPYQPPPRPESAPHRPPPAQQPPEQTPRRPQPPYQPPPRPESTPHRPPPVQQPPQQSPRRPPLTSQTERTERICDLQRLAQWIFRRYKTGRPIARVRVVNAAQPTYLLFFSGMEIDRIGQATTPLQAAIAWGNIQGFDAYRIGILNAVADLPRGTNVILAGHSQGGMEAQQIVPHLIERNGLRVPQVISYGAPITVGRTPGTSYQHVRALNDPLNALDRKYNLSATEIIRVGRSADPHTVYPEPSSGLDLYRVPQVSTLKTPCYEIDLTTIEEFQARNLFDLALGATNQRTSSGPPLNPTRDQLPDHLRVNCFWVALAQDRFWATGLPIPARCETRPIPSQEIPHVLARWHGHKRIDDGLGATPQEGFERHWNGVPVEATRREIEEALTARGSRAIIFAGDRLNPGVGHVFNARRGDNGEMEYFDGQDNLDASWRFAPDYNFWMYQTHP